MIILKQIKIEFSERILINNLSWQINTGSRIGLIGDNGAGKTTLFKTIIGQHKPDAGEIIISPNYKIGYLPQDLIVLSDYLLKEYLYQAAGIIQLKDKIKKYQEKLSKINNKDREFKKIAESYEKVLYQYEIKGGYSFEAKAKSTIKGLGFTEDDWLKPCSFFFRRMEDACSLSRFIIKLSGYSVIR